MNIEELKAKYEKYIGTDEFMDHVFALKKDLLSSDSNDFLEYHYLLMNNKNLDSGERDLIKSFFYSEVVNERDKTKVGEFLLKKFEQEKTPQKQAELIYYTICWQNDSSPLTGKYTKSSIGSCPHNE